MPPFDQRMISCHVVTELASLLRDLTPTSLGYHLWTRVVEHSGHIRCIGQKLPVQPLAIFRSLQQIVEGTFIITKAWLWIAI
ncbi:hypothetical protein DITRI_Ditri04bG0182600 [Diplodiscus trichospermus]